MSLIQRSQPGLTGNIHARSTSVSWFSVDPERIRDNSGYMSFREAQCNTLQLLLMITLYNQINVFPLQIHLSASLFLTLLSPEEAPFPSSCVDCNRKLYTHATLKPLKSTERKCLSKGCRLLMMLLGFVDEHSTSRWQVLEHSVHIRLQ